eukprot:TRINITY_DN17256_c0_g1_i2.p1 TRINITY_DN17256_c0_g1~~TRINITY_DN17256_c0_g1_i2.p1  ORF type:complete len:475 (-),score=155.06 TRINITY_DN17256_c0_g1_i2:718-2142(-)
MPMVRVDRPPRNEQLANINSLIASTERVIEEKTRVIQVEAEIEPVLEEQDLWLLKFDELAQKSQNIPLSHLSCCKEGGELFSALCMWVDVNQQYVDLGLFPQWYDIARELNIDSMKTEWVKVCIRPEQSFTRAILEIYMNDGGTLGEVIGALKRQEQYRIIHEISDMVEEFLDVYTAYHKANLNQDIMSNNNHIYSIMRTVQDSFNKAGYEDPLAKYQTYSLGFKRYLSQKNLTHGKNDILLNHMTLECDQDSGYSSPCVYEGNLPSLPEKEKSLTNLRESRSKGESKVKVNNGIPIPEKDLTVRILVVFSRDGVDIAQDIVAFIDNYAYSENPNIQVDIIRLNEFDIWNQLIQNPEGCIVKWLDEIDFVMPILSPQLMIDLHQGGEMRGPPAPTSALINKYIYSLLRTQYVSNGCQNTKVRPLMPIQFEPMIGNSKPVTAEPMFRMWGYADRHAITKRIEAIIKFWLKKNNLV